MDKRLWGKWGNALPAETQTALSSAKTSIFSVQVKSASLIKVKLKLSVDSSLGGGLLGYTRSGVSWRIGLSIYIYRVMEYDGLVDGRDGPLRVGDAAR